MRKNIHRRACRGHGRFCCGLRGSGRLRGQRRRGFISICRMTKKIGGGLGHHNFHDGFAITGAGNPASFPIGVTAAADQLRIADSARQLATSAAGGGSGEKLPGLILLDRDGNPGWAFNTPRMAYGYVQSDGSIITAA